MRRTAVAMALAVLLAMPASSSEQLPDDEAYLFALAQILRFEGSYREALERFAEAVDAAPEEPFLRLELAEFLLQLGRLEEAAIHADAARTLAPDSREATRIYGRIQLRLAERSPEAAQRARAAFEEIRRLDAQDVEARVTLGRLLLGQSLPVEAVEPLREARRLRPDDRLVSSLLAEALEAAGDSAETVEALRALVAEDPDFLQPRLILARVLARRGETEAAIALLEAAPERDRDNVGLLRQQALVHYRAGHWERAVEAAESWLERRPDDTAGRYLLALSLVASGRDSEAEEELAALVAANPENVDFTRALAQVVERQGRALQAARILEEALARVAPGAAETEGRAIWAQLIDLYDRSEQWQRIEELTGELLAAGGPVGEAEVRLARAQALGELGRSDEALAELEQIDVEEGSEDRIAARTAELLFGLERTAEANKALERLTRSDDVDRLMLAAEVLHRAERYSRAVPILRRALRLSPRNTEVLFWLGASLERSGRIGDAEGEFRRLLEIDGNFAPALNYLGYMWADNGKNLEEAVELVQRALVMEPNNGAYLDSLGWAYYRLGRYEEARRYLELAARFVGDDAVVFEHLGDLYAAVGEKQRAEEMYRKAVELEGDNRDAVRRKLEAMGDR